MPRGSISFFYCVCENKNRLRRGRNAQIGLRMYIRLILINQNPSISSESAVSA